MKTVIAVIFSAVFGSVVAIAARGFFSDASPSSGPVPEIAPISPESALPMHSKRSDVPPPVFAGPGFVSTSRPENVVWVEGTMMADGRVWVYLSDGRVFRETTKGLSRVDLEGAVIDGQRIWMRPTSAPRGGLLESRIVAPSPALPVAVASAPAPQVPPFGAPSSWRLDPDGVYRLTSSGSVGKP